MVYGHTDRCLACARWYANPVLMVVDAAFDSIGLNYIQSVVPKVELFRHEYVATGKINSCKDLVNADDVSFRNIWKNERSWRVAKDICSYLAELRSELDTDDRSALMHWARNAPLSKWRTDPIGCINGVGLVTYQYLRMMGGVDTVMPDKIVKKVIIEMMHRADIDSPEDDIEFVLFMEKIAPRTGYRAIELCWMTWLIRSEAWLSTNSKYAHLLDRI